ncbi:hypothetical protein GQ457_18G016780 [Hibiscus cannabinus]
MSSNSDERTVQRWGYAQFGMRSAMTQARDLIEFKDRVGSAPWAIAGDFNIITCPQESFDFNGAQGITGVMQDFRGYLETLDVLDHRFSGAVFTWCNLRDENPLSRKLDRFLVNHSWLTVFSNSVVEFLAPGCSDHSPCYMILKTPLFRPPKPFKFFNFRVEHPDFLRIVHDSWSLSVSGGNPLQNLFLRLKRLKVPLKNLNKEVFGDISNRARAKQVELEHLQSGLMRNPSAASIENVKIVAAELKNLLRAEELFFRQRSRIQYVKEGDQNSAFFFRHVTARNKVNTIRIMFDDQGTRLEAYEDISKELVRFFSSSLGNVDPNVTGISDELLKDILGVELSEDMREGLIAPVLGKEIKDVIFVMNGDKAPGSDGYTAKFFQVAWEVVGADVVKGIQFFFDSCSLPIAFNSTVITLVPKVLAPMKATDFRPISLCNIIYKCITKILTNRMKQWLSVLILPNQGAFLSGCDIVDNVLLAQELGGDSIDWFV